jgi:hypothetical protein
MVLLTQPSITGVLLLRREVHRLLIVPSTEIRTDGVRPGRRRAQRRRQGPPTWLIGAETVALLRNNSTVFPASAYTFKHALTHEVAYSSLLLERRRALHARIVEALEALAREGLRPAPTQSRQQMVEQVERLAHHAQRGRCGIRPCGMTGRRGSRP